MIGDRLNEAWQLYRCSDCDPDHYTGIMDDPEERARRQAEGQWWDKPYVLMVPEGEAKPDDCPRCGSRLSMCDGAKGLRIDAASTPAVRWAAQQAGSA